MSAFFCSPRTFANVLLIECGIYPKRYQALHKNTDPGMANVLLSAWVDLNQAAVRTRYAHHDVGKSIDEIEKEDKIEKDNAIRDIEILFNRYLSDKYSRPYILQLYHSVSCLIYQCSEGENYESNPTYRSLVALKNTIAHDILSAMPGFDELFWG